MTYRTDSFRKREVKMNPTYMKYRYEMRISPEDRDLLDKLAYELRLTRPGVLVNLIREKADELGLTAEGAELDQ